MDTVRIRKAKEGRGYSVTLNGVDVSKHVYGIEIRMVANEVPQVALVLSRVHVDLPEELAARVVVLEQGGDSENTEGSVSVQE